MNAFSFGDDVFFTFCHDLAPTFGTSCLYVTFFQPLKSRKSKVNYPMECRINLSKRKGLDDHYLQGGCSMGLQVNS